MKNPSSSPPVHVHVSDSTPVHVHVKSLRTSPSRTAEVRGQRQDVSVLVLFGSDVCPFVHLSSVHLSSVFTEEDLCGPVQSSSHS